MQIEMNYSPLTKQGRQLDIASSSKLALFILLNAYFWYDKRCNGIAFESTLNLIIDPLKLLFF